MSHLKRSLTLQIFRRASLHHAMTRKWYRFAKMSLNLMKQDTTDQIIEFIPPERKMLSSSKTTIYNPYLPTLRRYSICDMQSKMPWEHSRTTVPKDADKFDDDSVFYLYKSPLSSCPEFSSLSPEERIKRDYNQQDVFHPAEMIYARHWIKNRIPLKKHRIVDIPAVRDYSFGNYGLRSVKPEIKQKWREHVNINPEAPKKFLKKVPNS
ncbi:sperm microtubule inner protein 8-like isoform X2 [Rhodnius prolixus]|uniref:sperm microtubule inner protein 8-like isoform X2 n=2 Tax=Rhodnius prolixus TaxID=13249 RepID=UPI003D18EFEE